MAIPTVCLRDYSILVPFGEPEDQDYGEATGGARQVLVESMKKIAFGEKEAAVKWAIKKEVIPSAVTANPKLRLGVLILAVGAIAAYVIFARGQTPVGLGSMGSLSTWQIMAITTSAAGTIGIVTIIFKRALQSENGKFRGNAHWRPIVYRYYIGEGESKALSWHLWGYFDSSTLDKNGSGEASVYLQKGFFEHYFIGVMVTLSMPFYIIGKVVYNILRTAIIPFYIAVCLIYEKISGEKVFEEYKEDRPFRLRDIPEQMALSILRVVQAPFYGIAILFATLYSFIDPMNGRKLEQYIERDWNDGVEKNRSIWLPFYLHNCEVQKDYKFEGGGSPSKLGKSAFYIPGCWQPIAKATLQNRKIIKAESSSGDTNYSEVILSWI